MIKANLFRTTIFSGLAVFVITSMLTLSSCGLGGVKSAAIQTTLKKVAEEVNKSCPMTVDSETRLDNTLFKPESTLQYNYTLVNYEKADLNVDTLINNMRPNILNLIKTNPDLESLRKLDVTFEYSYRDKSGASVCQIVITPDDYKTK